MGEIEQSEKNASAHHNSLLGYFWIPRFRKEAHVTPEEHSAILPDLYLGDLLNRCLISLLAAPVMVFYLIYGLFVHFFDQFPLYAIFKLAAILTMLIPSAGVLIIRFSFRKKERLYAKTAECIASVYDFLMLAGIFLFFLSDKYDPNQSGNGLVAMGFSASYLWFMAFGVLPLSSIFSFSLTAGLAFVGTCAAVIPFYSEIQFPFQYFIVVIGAIMVGVYFRNSHYRNALNDFRSKENTRSLFEESSTDELTGVGNRRALNDFIALYVEHAKIKDSNLTLIIFDIDNFKEYNDNFSHLAGDNCLIQIVKATQKAFAGELADFYRFGGDEFIVLLANAEEKVLVHSLQGMLDSVKMEAIEAPRVLNKPYMSISIGCSTLHIDEHYSFANHLRASDEALYKCKGAGKGKAFYRGIFYSAK